jgi:hypothetical protein
VVRILDPLHAHPDQSGLVFFSYCFSAAAKQRSVYWTIFIATQSHNATPEGKLVSGSGRSVAEIQRWNFLQSVGWYNPCPRGNHAESGWDSAGVENATGSSAKRGGATKRRSDGLGQPGK